MITKELVKPSLTRAIRKQVLLNQERGDRSSLRGKPWDTYGTHIFDYERSFSGVLNELLQDLLKNKPFPVVIDLMGPSKTISTLFEKFPDKPKLGLAVSLEDLRSTEQKEKDAKLNVIQIAGDIMKSSTWREIEEKLQGHKADLIMERALAGFDCIPVSPRLYAILLNKTWSLLSKENGVLLFQSPPRTTLETKTDINVVNQWVNSLQYNGVNVLVHEPSYDWGLSIKTVKTPNSPEKLPFFK